MANLEQQQQQHLNAKSHLISVKDMHPMSRNVDCEVLVLQKDGDTTITRDGDQINRFLVADRTASILLNVWGEAGEYIQGGDILRITGARVGQDTMAFVEKPNMSEISFQNHFNNNASNWSRNDQQQQQQQHQHQQQQPYKQSNRIPNNNNRQARGYQNHPYNNNSVNSSNNNHRGGGGSGLGGGRRGQYHDNNRGRGGRYQQGIDNPV
ncbi:hypothetical protein BD408DRAFT_484576 [Parasitella parasitica]|nr:hypothetical protein BD408DRAFT_484576 [Parasitella parasitica]